MIEKKIFNSKAIILTVGSFKVSKNNLEINLDKSNFELNFKFLKLYCCKQKKFKSKCRVIVITSMNSEIPNLKVFLILCLKQKYQQLLIISKCS